MNTTHRIVVQFFLGITLLFPSLSAQASTVDFETQLQEQQLSQNLDRWQQLQAQKITLTESFQSMDIRSYPERDERFWWNPFWQNSRQNQAQLANRLLLDIQMVEKDIKSLQAQLLDQTAAFSETAITASALSNTQTTLWKKSDQWRLPVILEEPDWTLFSVAKLKPLSSELYQKRIQSLHEKQSQWDVLRTYLHKKTSLLPEASEEKKQIQLWINNVETQLKTITVLIKQLEVQSQIQ